MKKADLIVANSENCADLWYASGFHGPDDFIYFATDEVCGIVVSALEYDRARQEAHPGVQVFEPAEFGTPGSLKTPALLRAIGERFQIGCWRVPAYFPVRLAEHLRHDNFALDISEGAFMQRRVRKDATEIAAIADALAIAERAMRRARGILAEAGIADDGVLVWQGETLSSERLRQEINLEIVRHGGTPVGTIAASGAQGAQPHHAGAGPIRANTPIVLDIFPRSQQTGYWGDLTRTYVKGKAAPVVKRAFDLVRQARDEATARLAPGVDPQSVHQLAAAYFEQAGFPTGRTEQGEWRGFFHGLGHGVGMEIHEQPRLNSQPGAPLESGMVVTVEPGLYDPAWGGIRLEDLVVITDDGHRNLTTIETGLEID